jgi:hypothetical protein
MILIQVSYELVKQVNEVKFLKSFKSHLVGLKTQFQVPTDPRLFNTHKSELGSFIVQWELLSEKGNDFSQVEMKLKQKISDDFSSQFGSSLKTTIQFLKPWPDFLSPQV